MRIDMKIALNVGDRGTVRAIFCGSNKLLLTQLPAPNRDNPVKKNVASLPQQKPCAHGFFSLYSFFFCLFKTQVAVKSAVSRGILKVGLKCRQMGARTMYPANNASHTRDLALVPID